jgi:uncharacterized membrane protein
MSNVLFSGQDQERIVTAISNAELLTSGEIRVHVEGKCPGDPVEKAFKVFRKLGMHQTAERNGVLFYIATEHRKLAIVGDEGIHQKVPSHFWDDIKEQMVADFKAEGYTEGLVKGIQHAGAQLGLHFPRKEDDTDELSNEVTFEK